MEIKINTPYGVGSLEEIWVSELGFLMIKVNLLERTNRWISFNLGKSNINIDMENEINYMEILDSIKRSMEQASNYKYVDLSDIGNEIGVAVGKHIVKHELDKHDFISGIKHGISLTDGTH